MQKKKYEGIYKNVRLERLVQIAVQNVLLGSLESFVDKNAFVTSMIAILRTDVRKL